jgi:hypothetical protein
LGNSPTTPNMVMTNKQVRQWYAKQVDKIRLLNESWINDGIGIKQRAINAWQIRHDARLRARHLMANPREVELLRNRDLKLYGDPDGPTFEFLVERAINLGLSDDKIYEAIINDSYKTNPEVDKRFDA